MLRILVPMLLLMFMSSSCTEPDRRSLAAFDVFCEMVASDAKPIALHYPMEPEQVDRLWDEFRESAQEDGLKLYREDDFPETLLFPARDTGGKTVVIIYKGNRLEQYLQLRSDIKAFELSDKPGDVSRMQQEALARRMGWATVGGSDAHVPGQVGCAYTLLDDLKQRFWKARPIHHEVEETSETIR